MSTIIETVKTLLNGYSDMSEFCNKINYDFAENTAKTYGLYSNGDSLLNTDVLGGEKHRHNFVLYACNQPIGNYERLEQSEFLLNFGYWLEKQKGATITAYNGKRTGYITKMSCANAMLYSVPTGDIKDGVTYQIQLNAEYYINP